MFGKYFTDSFVALIIVLGIWAYFRYTKPLKTMTNQIDDIINIIYEKKNNGDSYEDILIDTKKYIENKEGVIYKQFEKFVNDNRKKYTVSKFFNPYIMLHEVSKRNIAELVPGFLTALGILGTFLGLSSGLPTDIASSADMTKTLQPLMSGMSLAFTTSIYGILASVVWNYVDKRAYKLANYKLYTLVEELEHLVDFKITDERIELIENYNCEQAESLKKLATDLSAEMQNILVPGIQEGISNAFTENMLPSFEKMEESITLFTENASKAQTEGVSEIVDSFVESMNNALGGQFDNLAETIKELCEWQKETAKDLDILIKEIKQTSENQIELNKSTENIVIKLEEYYASINESNQMLLNHINVLDEMGNSISESSKLTHDLFTQTISRYEGIDENNRIYFDKMTEAINKMDSQWMDILEVMEQKNITLKESTNEFGNNLHEGLRKTFEEYDSSLTDILRHLKGTIEDIKKSADESRTFIVESNEGLSRAVDEISRTIDNIPRKIEVEFDRNIAR
jgi:hypothetical protein